MSIERKILKKTARKLGAMACVGALILGGLSACISPDLEPPGAASTAVPGRPGGPTAAADTDQQKAAAGGATAQTAGANPSTGVTINTPPTMMTAPTSPGVGAAGSGAAAAPAAGMMPNTAASMAATGAAGSSGGAAGAAAESTKDADAGVDTP